MAIKILHTADWHYGLSSWSEGKKTERNQEIEKCLEFMLKRANEEKVDLIINAGDTLDTITPPSAETAKYILSIFSEMGKIAPTVIILGNHDWKGLAAFREFAEGSNVYICDKYREIEIGDMRVFAVPYIDRRKILRNTDIDKTESAENDIMNQIYNDIEAGAKSDKTNILVVHGSVEGLFYTGEEVFGSDLLIKPEFFSNKIDYTALGHIHNFQRIENRNTEVYYSGSVVQCTFGEEKNKAGFILADVEKGKTKIKHIETPNTPLTTLEMEYNEEGMESLKEKMKNRINELGEEGYYRILVKGENFPNYAYSDILEAHKNIVSVKILGKDKLENTNEQEIENISDLSGEFKKYLLNEDTYSDEIYEEFLKYFNLDED